ncbi:geranylgeranyl transferase type-1 subunit beta [Gnomoniopsis smithogilvyi]|uniref:Geranylgeranyl transferase type-1 subunit beta n=1 Tax=Gnomoniopsis smithogilvyi TaxID=1191159 RepID=A0A9W8YYL5_9PEZI|nr:geranylgeranyl transferase type-1 subunit beta [Gnomoniopsis smithogilvyi]
MDPFDPPLDTARHLRYWQRCIRTLLPHHYTSMDSTRLSLGFFIICSIDLLTPSEEATTTTTTKPLLTSTDRANLRRWVLSCQHPLGGFTASPTHVFAPQYQQSDAENAHIGGTYFALLLLALLSEDNDDNSAGGAFAGVNRVATLRWLRRLQRPEDGSFGEVVYDAPAVPGQDEKRESVIAGGKDMRYSYLAAAVRWMLRGDLSPSHPAYVEDIDVPALVAHIRRGQTYDGGFAESCAHESHAGYGYCAVAALALLDRPLECSGEGRASRVVEEGIADRKGFVAWLASRQFAYLAPENEADDEDEDDDPATANFRLAELSLSESTTTPQLIGFNGRCNKVADTCYTWWTLGSLAVLDLPDSTDPAAIQAQRRFLLEKTQHIIGGFGKHPGSPPDVGHACLGLAALATMGDPALKKLDASLCVSVETVRKVEKARRVLLEGSGTTENDPDCQKWSLADRLVNTAARMGGGRPEWLDAMA